MRHIDDCAVMSVLKYVGVRSTVEPEPDLQGMDETRECKACVAHHSWSSDAPGNASGMM